MALRSRTNQIIWSPKAARSYDDIISYLISEFTEKEIQKFVRKSNRILELITLDPGMFRISEKGKHKHIVVLTKQTTLYYRFKPNKKEIELLLFWDTRQNPNRVKY